MTLKKVDSKQKRWFCKPESNVCFMGTWESLSESDMDMIDAGLCYDLGPAITGTDMELQELIATNKSDYKVYFDSLPLCRRESDIEVSIGNLNELNHKAIRNPECEKCLLNAGCNTVCIMPKYKQANLMIVISAPDKDTDQTGDTLINRKLTFFYEILETVCGIPRDTVYLTYLTKCRPIDGRKAELDEAKKCLSYLEQEIDFIKPKAILALGELPLKTLTGLYSITNSRGTVSNFHGIPLVCTFDPFFVYNDRKYLMDFAKDIDRANNIAEDVKVTAKSCQYKILKTEKELQELVGYIKEAGEVSFDIETTGLEFWKDKITVIALAFNHGAAYVIPIHHAESPFKDCPELPLKYLNEIFSDSTIVKRAQNIKFDVKFLLYEGVTITGLWNDAMVMHHLLDENKKHGLKEMVPEVWPQFAGYDDEVKKYKWSEVPLEILSKYCAQDADFTLRLNHYFEYQLMQEPELYNNYRNIACPAMKILNQMEYQGMPIDIPFVNECIDKITLKIASIEVKMRGYKQVKRFEQSELTRITKNILDDLETKIQKRRVAMGKETKIELNYRQKIEDIKSGVLKLYDGINFNSDKQLGQLLYTDPGFGFKMPYVREKRTYAPATGEEHLKDLHDRSGFADDLIEYRSMQKTLSTYYIGIRDRCDENGVVHTGFLQHGTKTGRLCVGEDTMLTTDGGLVRIGDLIPLFAGIRDVNNKRIKVKTHTGEYKFITHAINKGYEEMYEVELENGYKIECTKEHRFFVDSGAWLSLQTLIDCKYLPAICCTKDNYFESYRIKKVMPIGVHIVADITVEDDHSYVGNGIVNHNSSRNPNVQNIPRTGDFNGLIKKMFGSMPGYKILACDFSQAELRLTALAANETKMIEVYSTGGDIHTTTAKKVLGISDEDWTKFTKEEQKEFRFRAKAVNFGFLYAAGAKTFKAVAKNDYNLILSDEESEQYRVEFFDLYAALPAWHRASIRNAESQGFVKTPFGRKRRVPDIYSSDEYKKAAAERESINAPIQGAGGELTIFCINILKTRLDPRVRFANTVHDSIIMYVPEELINDTAKIVKDTCENSLTQEYFGFDFAPVGMKVDIEVGDNWKELNPYEIN